MKRLTEQSTRGPSRVVGLGDALGPIRHLGCCGGCRVQFVSTSEQVALLDGGLILCLRCDRCESLSPLCPGEVA